MSFKHPITKPETIPLADFLEKMHSMLEGNLSFPENYHVAVIACNVNDISPDKINELTSFISTLMIDWEFIGSEAELGYVEFAFERADGEETSQEKIDEFAKTIADKFDIEVFGIYTTISENEI